GYGSFGPLTQAMYDARHRAISRMLAECAELGGHGIVGVSLSIGSFPAGGLEFKAIGTAVRAPGAAPLREPFSSDLSGQDFAKLIHAGWVPSGLALGISVGARHDDWLTVARPAGGQATRKSSGTPNWSTTAGTTPASSWKRTSGGWAARASWCPGWICGCTSASARCRSTAKTTSWK